MKYVLFVSTLLLLLTSCKKKVNFKDGERRLPKATEKGRGMFACYINGQTYSVKRQEKITYDAEQGYLFIENRNDNFEFRLFIYEGLFGEGKYTFSNTGEEWISSDYQSFYGVKEGGVNWLEVTRLDLNENVVSGKFEIDLIDENGDEKIIRDGRFDLEI